MSPQPVRHRKNNVFPDRAYLVQLMKKYGKALFTPCPSSESLVRYAEEPASLDGGARRSIVDHLTVCLDCQDKLRWLAEPSDEATDRPVIDAVYVFQVHVPRDQRINDREALAYAARSFEKDVRDIPAVPCISSEDGRFYAEIGQDLDDRLFLYFDRLPRAFQWHAIKVRAVTQDRQILESPARTIGHPRIEIARRPDLRPVDLARIELHFILLRPR